MLRCYVILWNFVSVVPWCRHQSIFPLTLPVYNMRNCGVSLSPVFQHQGCEWSISITSVTTSSIHRISSLSVCRWHGSSVLATEFRTACLFVDNTNGKKIRQHNPQALIGPATTLLWTQVKMSSHKLNHDSFRSRLTPTTFGGPGFTCLVCEWVFISDEMTPTYEKVQLVSTKQSRSERRYCKEPRTFTGPEHRPFTKQKNLNNCIRLLQYYTQNHCAELSVVLLLLLL